MNELYIGARTLAKVRKSLFASTSAFVVGVGCGGSVQAADDGRPTFWIEGGWHFESIAQRNDFFAPPLDATTRAAGFPSLTEAQGALGRTYGGEGSLSFQPKGSDWIFTASARYGRVQTRRQNHNEKTIVGPQMKQWYFNGINANIPVTPTFDAYAIGFSTNNETHAVVDFQAGKDIGIGMLGRGTHSVISFGVRYAQMSAKSDAQSHANPAVVFEQQITHLNPYRSKYQIFSSFDRSGASTRRWDSLRALGPSLSLKNTTGFLGTVDDGQLALEWGVNAAILFGRQKATSTHQSSVLHHAGRTYSGVVHAPVTYERSRRVTVPNVGGFAGLSYRLSNAKLSAGYRADFFFGAKDVGLETRKITDVGFHGPYATFSVGLGE